MKLLVTGATGFLGLPLVGRLLNQGHEVVAMSRNQGKLISLQQEYSQYSHKLTIFSGEVNRYTDVDEAMQGVHGVYHLAASKHVGLAEKYVIECFESNAIGSYNIFKATTEHKPGFCISISTDKAAQVSGVYGATKMLMERLSCQFETINKDTDYFIVRYGNVLYSTGSVLCKWLDLIKKGSGIIVTEPDATRFFWTIEQALDLIEQCLMEAEDSKPFVPEMKSMTIGNLLKAMITKYLGVHNDYIDVEGNFTSKVNIIGLQAGENMHEKILEDGKPSNEVEQFTIKEIMELI